MRKSALAALLTLACLYSVPARAIATGPFLLYDTATEFNVLATWCYQGNGIAKTLAQVSQCGRTNVQNWPIERWQQLMPCVTDLSNYVDRVALQCAIDSGAADNSTVSMYLYGNAKLDEQLTIGCSRPVHISGAGGSTTLSVSFEAATTPQVTLDLGVTCATQTVNVGYVVYGR
jgi:hypothetical protein